MPSQATVAAAPSGVEQVRSPFSRLWKYSVWNLKFWYFGLPFGAHFQTKSAMKFCERPSNEPSTSSSTVPAKWAARDLARVVKYDTPARQLWATPASPP